MISSDYDDLPCCNRTMIFDNLYTARPLQNHIKPTIFSFRRKPESRVFRYFLDSGPSPDRLKKELCKALTAELGERFEEMCSSCHRLIELL